MKRHIAAVAGALVTQMAIVSPALAYPEPPRVDVIAVPGAEPDLTFMLPINGHLDPQTAGTDEPAMKLWPLRAEIDKAADSATTVAATPAVAPLDGGGPIIIDNDEASLEPVQQTYQWQEVPDQPGKTRMEAGAKFPVSVISQLSSKTARVGDSVEGRLKSDITIGGRLVARKGARVVGHVSTCTKAKSILRSYVPGKRWWRPNGALGIQFDEIITDTGEHLPLVAAPAQASRIVKNANEGRVLGINHKGEVATPLSIQLKHQALHLAIRSSASAAGVFSFGIVPVAYGVVGAMNPSFAYLHPVGKNVPHRRLKGFTVGFVSGLPGGFLITDSIIKGQEAVIKPGDEFLAELKQDFTGEASTGAELVPGASRKVHGEVLPGNKRSGKSK